MPRLNLHALLVFLAFGVVLVAFVGITAFLVMSAHPPGVSVKYMR